MGRTKQTGRKDQPRMQIEMSSSECLQLRSVIDAEGRTLSSGLGYGNEDALHTGKLRRAVVLEIYNAEIDSMDSRDEISDIACKFNVPYEKVLAIRNGELYANYTLKERALKTDVTIDDVRDTLDLMFKENDRLEKENDGMRIIYDELQVEKVELQEEKDSLEVKNAQLEATKTGLENECGTLRMENSSLHMTNDDLKAKLEFDNRRLNAKIQRLKTLLRVTKDELCSLDPSADPELRP